MPQQPARILIAEDNPQGAELIEAYLDGAGWNLKITFDGEETLKQLKEWKPDALLLDIMMPKLSGFEVCKRLRADHELRDTPVLMITALDQASDVDRAVEVGTNDYLTKPIDKIDLVLRIKALLESRKQSTDLDRTVRYIDMLTSSVA